MPLSGALSAAFKSPNICTLSTALVSSVSMALPTDWIVSSRPQKVQEQTEEHQQSDGIAAGVARFIEA